MKKIIVSIPQRMAITRTFTYEKIVNDDEALILQSAIDSLDSIECSPEYLFGHDFKYIGEDEKIWDIEEDEIETFIEDC